MAGLAGLAGWLAGQLVSWSGGQAARLRGVDVGWSGREAVLRLTETKTGADQLVRIRDAGAAAVLRGLVRRLGSRSDFLFSLPFAQLRTSFKYLLRLIGLDSPRFTLHSLRHGGATLFALRDVPLEQIACEGRWYLPSSACISPQTGLALLSQIALPSSLEAVAERLAARWPWRVL